MIPEEQKVKPGSGRLEALGDGIFAVAMTILVIPLSLPVMHTKSLYEFINAFHEIWTDIICCVISFIVLGIMWFGHHMVFQYVKFINRYFIFLGVLFYMFVCFVPFSTSFLAHNALLWQGQFLYGLNLSMCNITLFIQWKYGINRPSLMPKQLPDVIKKQASFLLLISPVVYIVAIIISTFAPAVSLGIFIITPVLYLVPGKLDQYLP